MKTLQSTIHFADFVNNIDTADVYFTYNGRIIEDFTTIPSDALICKHYRLRGGKGGFGSMLRAIGSQIEKTTNHEMCRDLNGRRMRDVNTEKKLKQWYSTASERDREKMRKYYEKQCKRRELLAQGPLPGHKFSDREYEKQKRKISHDLRGALDTAIENLLKEKQQLNPISNLSSSSTVQTTSTLSSNAKRARLWIEELDKELSSDTTNSSNSSSSSDSSSEDEGLDSNTTRIHKNDDNVSSQKVMEENPITQLVNPEILNQNKNLNESDNQVNNSITTSNDKFENSNDKSTVVPISDTELKMIENPLELENKYSLDVLKQSLIVRGLKCGGTLKERALRLYSIKDLKPEEYPLKLLAKLK